MAILLSISLYEIPFASRLLSQNVFCYLANILGIIDTNNKSGVEFVDPLVSLISMSFLSIVYHPVIVNKIYIIKMKYLMYLYLR